MATDYHEQVRNAVRDTLKALPSACAVREFDDLDDLARAELPVIACVCVGPEQDRPEMTTNASDGVGYAVAVALLGGGATGGEKTPGLPTPTQFRRDVRVAFHNKRLSGVDQVGWCEVSDSGELFDEREPAFSKLQTAVVVTAVGRFPRS